LPKTSNRAILELMIGGTKANPSSNTALAPGPAGDTGGGRSTFSPDPGEKAAVTPAAAASWQWTIAAAGLIGLCTTAAYHNSFGGAFAYDDDIAIVENRTIRQLWPLWPVLSPPCNGETVGGRPLLNLTLAVNYAVSGLNVWSYHVANLMIHIGAALLLFGILRRTFLSPALRDRFAAAAAPLALAGALLWAVHPLQTESVTYIVQRAESLAGFFYLLTLYCVIRGAGTVPIFARAKMGLSPSAGPKGTVPFFAEHDAGQNKFVGGEKGDSPLGEKGDRPLWPAVWFTAAVLACLLGMACKEILVTAPLIVLLYDRTFLAGSFAQAWRRRRGLYLGLAATWGLLGYLLFSTGLIGRQTELGAPDPWSYARTQPGVILHYLRLSVWPSSLCMGYDWPVADRLGEILPGTVVVALLLAATLWGLLGRRAWGFLGAWFFLILAPTSSILPLNQLAVEHRMYLPLAAVAVLGAAGGYALWEKLLPRLAGQGGQSPGWVRRFAGFAAGPSFLAAGPSSGTVPGLATIVRWAAPVAAWAAVLAALGWATVVRNRVYQSKVAIWQHAVDIRPQNPFVHNNLGIALAAAGRREEAIEQYRQALRLKPDFAEALGNLGLALADLGRTDEAIEQYRQTLRQKPDFAEVHNILGAFLAGSGNTAEAIEHYHEALRLKPDFAEAHSNLGLLLASLGRSAEAIEQYQQALRLKPDYAVTHNNLGLVLAGLGRSGEAIAHYQQALHWKPDYVEAQNNLAIALAGLGKTDEAIERCQQALRLKPDYATAHYNLARVLTSVGRTKEAVEHYQRFLQLVPDSVEAHNNLAWLLATREPAEGGDPDRAVRLAQRARALSGGENAQCLDTLAAAYAAAGRLADAIIAAEQAARLAESAGQTPLAQVIRARLELYRAGRPYREQSQPPRRSEP
jgi:tetratricopeptide (TPR) repeat protein